MKKGDQLCILRAEVKTDADALNLLRLLLEVHGIDAAAGHGHARITAAVVQELMKRERFTVVKETTRVDAVVEGEITVYSVQPVGFTGGESSKRARCSGD